MWYTSIYSNSISKISSDIHKAERVPTIRADGDQDPVASRPLRMFIDNARHIVPTAVLVRVQSLRNDLHKAVKGQVQDL